MLRESLLELANHLQHETHLYPLLNERMTVKFVSEHDVFFMCIDKFNMGVLDEISEKPMVSITGSEHDLLKVILGLEGLQMMKKRQSIKMNGRLRHILRLESLLYCSSNAVNASVS